jgi:SAM-dependent methyltransferase
MERAAWLKQMRDKAEKLYDYFSPLYWVKWGLYPDQTHQEYLGKFLERVSPHSTLLSAGCGAGRYDGVLLEAGYRVVGIDQSEGMLARAREHFPGVRYEKMGLQEMDFREAFEGAICIDALEHVPPEDWPVILGGFWDALKPGGVLYFTVDISASAHDLAADYERAKSQGLPVVFGEVVAGLDAAYQSVVAAGTSKVDGELADKAVYHYHPPLDRVRTWLGRVGLVIEAEGPGEWYQHFVVRKIG